jgi:uncharacterized membrane protein
MENGTVTKPLTRAGIFLGVGLGGFVDGILFHQILQMHGMLTARLPKESVAAIEINMFWDGLFHAFTWMMTLTGVILLWRAHFVPGIQWSGRALGGAMFLGWGLFNLIEGVINHHILHLHHVVEQHGQSAFDVLFLLSGVLFMAGGWWAIRSARGQADGSSRS